MEKHCVVIENMAAAWHGGFNDSAQYVNNNDLRSKISSAMDYWFSNDFSDSSCLVDGGQKACGCSTPGLWNPNWFANVSVTRAQPVSSC